MVSDGLQLRGMTMATVIIRIETDNASISDGDETIGEVLNRYLEAINELRTCEILKMRDLNGNFIGDAVRIEN